VNELRRAIPFLLLPLLLLAAGCQLLPPGFLVPASPSPGPVVEATLDPSPSQSPSPSLVAEATPSPAWPNQPVAERQSVSELRDRRDAWEATQVDDYDWRILLTCYCQPRDWIDVSVVNGIVNYAELQDGESLPPDALERRFLTVDAQFDAMLDAARKGGIVQAAFGPHGQPVAIHIDSFANVADDELSIATQGFVPAQVGAAPSSESEASLRDRIAAWESAGIDDYTWRIRFSCFCSPREPLDVRVVDGEVAWTRNLEGAPRGNTHDGPLTVDQLFETMLAALDEGGIVRAEYGPAGQPRSVTLDYAPNGDDDELYVETRRFTPTP
jgi:hypothetical protein